MSWTDEARRRAGEITRARMADPAYAAWAREHGRRCCAKMLADPEIRARRLERQRETSARNYADPAFRARIGCLPPMTDEERLLYRKLTSNGATRADALRVMGKADQ